MKRVFKWLAVGVTVVVGLLLLSVALLAATVDLDKLVNEEIAKRKPQIEERLGRKVEIGKVTTKLLPTLGGRIEDLRILADTSHKEDDQPLLAISSLGFEVALWDALTSFGKRIVVSAVYVDGLRVSLVRYPDGRLSYQDILDRQPKAPPEEPARPSEGLSPEVKRYLDNTSIGELRLSDGQIRLVDLATATGQKAESLVKKLNLKLNDVRLKDPIRIRLDAAVFAEATNLELETTVGPLPPDLKLEGLPRVAGTRLKMTDVDVSRIAPYLGAAVPVRIDSALVSTSWELGELKKDAPLPIAGTLSVKNLQVERGKRFDLGVDARMKVNLGTLGADIERLEVRVGTVAVAMAGSLADLASAPRFKDLTIKSSTLNFGTLLEYYPAGRSSLPPGMRVEGNAELEVSASGDAEKQSVKAKVDLKDLDVLYPGRFLKPRGVALALRLDGTFTGNDAQIALLELVLDEIDLQVRGSVHDFKSPRLDLTAAAKPFGFDRLARLVPAAAEGLAKAGAKASGEGKLGAKVRGSASDIDASLDFSLLGAKLDIPGTRIEGDITLAAKAKGNPSKDLSAQLKFDADQAVIQVKELMNKGVKTPLHLDLDLARTPERLDVKRFDLKLAELGIGVVGGFDFPKGIVDVKIDLQRLDLEKFSKTITAIPADKAKKGYLDFKMSMRGDPNKMETLELGISKLDARFGRSDVRGELTVANLVKPKVKLAIASNMLDVDELSPPKEERAAEKPAAPPKPGAPPPPRQDDPTLKDYSFDGRFDLKRVVVRGEDLRDFRGDVGLHDGVLALRDATFVAYDGTVTAKGTEATIWKGRMPFVAKMAVQGVDTNKVLSAKTRYANTLYGKANLALDLKGDGFETPELEEKLAGTMSMSMTEGRLAGRSMLDAVFGNLSVLDKIPGYKAPKGENKLKDLKADFLVKDGKMQLARPMVASVDGNRVALDGAIGIAGKLFLKGTFFLPGALVEKATSGKCKAGAEMPVPVDVNGTFGSPEFRPDAKGIAAELAKACLKGALADKATSLLGDQAKKALGVDLTSKAESEKKLREEADRAKADGEARARAEADKAKAAAADAEKKAREDLEKKKREAEEKAKQKAKDAFKKFGIGR